MSPELQPPPTSQSLKVWALWWARTLGIPVFPCRGKVPRTARGVKEATLDAAQIEAWWDQWPSANIGGATGSSSGIWAWDVDGDDGRASQALLEAELGRLPSTLATVTGGGGEHRLFRMPADRDVRNRARVLAGVDVRGSGGYIILPPSLHPSGRRYTLAIFESPTDAPPHLLDLVCKPVPPPVPEPPPRAPQRTGLRLVRDERRRVLGMVRAAAERIATAPKGARNDTVNRECYGVGGFLAAAGLTPEDVEGDLRAAAERAEQPGDTASRALREGYEAPRTLPEDVPPDEAPPDPPAERDPNAPLLPNEPDPVVYESLDLQRNDARGTETVRAILPNAIAILAHDRRWVRRLHLCLFRQRNELDGRAIADSDEGEVVVWCHRAYGVTFPIGMVHDAIVTVCARSPVHPVREYLRGLAWDGVTRIDRWLIEYAGVDEDGLGYGWRFLVSAVARALSPGCQVDQVLVLADPRGGQGKTALVRTLAGLDWASDTALDVRSKDAYQQLCGVWIYELSELATLKRGDIESIKGFVTSRVDRYRPPYGRNTVETPRQCVFLGTTNESRFLPEGGRRWWIRRVVRAARLQALEADRDQLWAEAVARFDAGERWWLEGDAAEAQRIDAEQHVQQDPWADAVAAIVADGRPRRTSDVLRELGIPLDRRTRADEMRAGKILEGFGLTVARGSYAGERGWWWRRHTAAFADEPTEHKHRGETE